jgi:predicted transcriptional regulator
MENYRKEFNLRCLAWRKKYRSQFEIMASMLEAARDNGATRFSIMKFSDVNFVKVKEYLDFLTDMGLIDEDGNDGQILYTASEKGLEYLRQYYVLLGILLSMPPMEIEHLRNGQGLRRRLYDLTPKAVGV